MRTLAAKLASSGGHLDALPGAVVHPAVVHAPDVVVLDPARVKLREAMAHCAAIKCGVPLSLRYS